MANNDQRRRQLAREKFERQQRRRSEARKRSKRRNTVIASTVAAVVVIGGGSTAFAVMGGSSDGKADAAASPSSVPSPSASAPSEPKMTIDKTAPYTMKLKTNRGDVSIDMNAAKTPHTVNSFKYLADKGFFDNTKCHRLTTQGIYVLQCGDPKGDGTGGPGYTIPDENLSSLGKAAADGSVTYKAGTVAMANTGQPHTGGSQFFLVYKDSKLKPSYTPFGTMDSAGLKLVKNVAKDGVEGSTKKQPVTDGAPKDAVTVQKATVDKQ
ncbi:peptidylprolyl isomerase [Streptomyces sp. NRRL F-5126]|uniref:peptidylprolyl isomerase n=1 Tax=Streptomyces sp. NRRL F-5126 TaxID=1463857 RepID=UPI0004CA5F32|nr:peptidylprolyl isomerase [Streptomyces sp. NRRL F-5126]